MGFYWQINGFVAFETFPDKLPVFLQTKASDQLQIKDPGQLEVDPFSAKFTIVPR